MHSESNTNSYGTALLLLVCTFLILSSPIMAALTALEAAPNSVTISWTAPGDDGTTGTATSYDVRYSTSMINEANWDAATQATGEPSPQAAGSSEQFALSGLNPSTTYYIAIKVADEVPNWSGLSNVVVKSTTVEETAPAAIADASVGNPTENSLTLSWTAPGDDGSTGTATWYDVRYSTSTISEANWDAATQVSGEPAPQSAGSSQSLTIAGLSPEQTYFFAIKTADEVPNWSALSNIASGSTSAETVPPAAVADLGNSGSTETSITLVWTAPGDDGASGTASSYDIRYSASSINASNWDAATRVTGEPSPASAGSTESFTVGGLSSGSTYFFALKTADEVPNWSALSNVASAATQFDGTSPEGVDDLLAGLPTLNSLTLVWSAPGDDGAVGTASQYDVRYSTSPINVSNWDAASQISGEPSPSVAGTPESLTVVGLAENTTYYFALKTADERDNWSVLSNVAANTTALDNTPPAAINDLSAVTGEEDGQIELTWTAPGDDELIGQAMGYSIRYSLDPITEGNWESALVYMDVPNPGASGTTEAITMEGLTPGELFYLAIKTYDDAANPSLLSNEASAISGLNIISAAGDLAAPTFPANDAIVATSLPVLKVENANASSDNVYYFELATDPDFYGLVAGSVVDQQPGDVTEWKVNERLAVNGTYYWRVGTNDEGYSEVFRFNVEAFTHAYPNPVRLADVEAATFTDIPEGSDLTLLSVSGNVVREWSNVTGNDIVWDGTNESGNQVASGTYLWYVSGTDANGKLLVVR